MKSPRTIEILTQIKQHCEKEAISNEMIAERTGLMPSNIGRVLSSKYSPPLDVLLLITESVGLEIIVKEKAR